LAPGRRTKGVEQEEAEAAEKTGRGLVLKEIASAISAPPVGPRKGTKGVGLRRNDGQSFGKCV